MKQLILGAITTATLALAVAAPQSASAASQPVHPTATTGSVQAMISSTFGAYANQALMIARCESSYNPNARNTTAVIANGRNLGHAMGVFQIVDATWASTSQAKQSPYNAAANIKAAYEIFVRDGHSFREWQCKA